LIINLFGKVPNKSLSKEKSHVDIFIKQHMDITCARLQQADRR